MKIKLKLLLTVMWGKGLFSSKKILKKLTACKVENVKSVSEPSGSSGWTLSQPISLVYLKITPSDVHSTCL